jgi:hypothetical protein
MEEVLRPETMSRKTVETKTIPAIYDVYSCSSLPAQIVLQRRLIQPSTGYEPGFRSKNLLAVYDVAPITRHIDLTTQMATQAGITAFPGG